MTVTSCCSSVGVSAPWFFLLMGWLGSDEILGGGGGGITDDDGLLGLVVAAGVSTFKGLVST